MLWLGGCSKEESFEYYEIHTQESVAGLGIKAPVRLLGVEIGNVENISIYDKENLGVNILIKIKKGTPIKEDTFATLQLQGITGLKFIQLQGGSKNSPRLQAKGEEEFPVIQFKESFFATIDRQSEHIFSLVKRADDKSKELFSDKNIKNLEILLSNLAQLSTTLNENSKALSQNITNTSLKLGEMADNVSLSAKGFNSSLKDIQKGALALSSFAKKANVKLDSYDDLRLSLEENLELLKKVLLESSILIQNLQKSPSDLIFKETQPKLGPGEK
ncbi:MlaD family protein [Campylobacter coli]|uniref:MlaD family protein n=1 Tax=Campylobacter coli TaxID=195 RepID=UPI0037BEC2B3